MKAFGWFLLNLCGIYKQPAAPVAVPVPVDHLSDFMGFLKENGETPITLVALQKQFKAHKITAKDLRDRGAKSVLTHVGETFDTAGRMVRMWNW